MTYAIRIGPRAQWAIVALVSILVAMWLAHPASAVQVLTVGDRLPEFSPLRELSRHTDARSEFRGIARGPAVVVIWASWCPACRAELESLERMTRRFSPLGLSVIAVSVDAAGSERDVRELVNEAGATFDVVLDPKGSVGRILGVVPIPQAFLIGADGVIEQRLVGEQNWMLPEITDQLTALLRNGREVRVQRSAVVQPHSGVTVAARRP